jgi:hypothetical protein
MADAPAAEGADDLDPLTRLAIKHGTDKWGPHFYTPVYHALFSHLRDKPLRLLEIGVGGYAFGSVGGASLAMWAEYFPAARIVGIDIAPKTLRLDPRITTVVGAQDDAKFLARLCDEHGPFDIVIDDGSHNPREVVASFVSLFPRLPDGAIYVIEDVQTTFWPETGGSRQGGATMELALQLLRDLNHAEIAAAQPEAQPSQWANRVRAVRAYHNLLVIDSGDNREPSNFNYRLDNPHAARALQVIERELARDPTPAGLANLIDTLTLARDFASARNRAAEALARWPDHPGVLMAAANAAYRAGHADEFDGYAERLTRLEPDNQRVRQLYLDAKTRLRQTRP